MIWRRIWSNSIKNRLTFLFFSITAGAIVVIYFYVVPQLESNLTSQKLDVLKRDSRTYTRPLELSSTRELSARRLDALVHTLSEKSGARVTLMGIPRDETDPKRVGDAPPYVISDSQDVETPLNPSNALVLDTARSRGVRTSTTAQGGGSLAQAARTILDKGQPSLVVVYSKPLDDVRDNVALIRRQVLIAGLIALIVAMTSGYYAASVLARRVKRLERAAGEVAAGNFSRPIPVDSEDELGQLAIAFNEMQRRLARLDQARKEFIANASHELRTPIFSLGGFVELLQDEDLDEDTRTEFLATMRSQVDRLQKLATDLLDLSRLDAGSLEVELEPVALLSLANQVTRELGREPVSLRTLANQITHEFAAAAARGEATLEIADDDADPTEDIEALCDGQRVAQILRILLDNALTHTEPGTHIRVRSGSEPAPADGSRRDGRPTAFLEVSDDGPGIKRRELAHVFERFYTGGSGGSGLGLAIARELAHRMRGRLDVRSRPGETVFRLTLPQAGEAPARPARAVAVPAAPEAGS
jgi:two-component system, OmpR family, sensor kinase